MTKKVFDLLLVMLPLMFLVAQNDSIPCESRRFIACTESRKVVRRQYEGYASIYNSDDSRKFLIPFASEVVLLRRFIYCQ